MSIAQEERIHITRRPEIHPAGHHDGARPLDRERIVLAAEACFAESGYDGTTIRAIAARLNCAVGSIYRHFTDKRELLLTCGQRLMRPVLDALAEGESFESSAESYIEQAAAREELYRLQFWLVASSPGRRTIPPAVEQVLEAWSLRLDGRREAERRWAMIHGLLMLGRPVEQIMKQCAIGAFEVEASPPVSSWRSNDAEDVTLL